MNPISDYFKEEIDKMQIPQSELDQLIEKTIKRANKKERNCKWITISSVAILLIGLFISSTLISPAMAQIASKIPLINLFYHPDESIVRSLKSTLTSKGYKINSVGYSVNPKVISIQIDGPDIYLNKVKKDVKEVAMNILNSKGYNAFAVDINNNTKVSQKESLNEEQLKEKDAVKNIISGKLKQLHYPASVRVDPHQHRIYVTLDLNAFQNFKEAKKDIPIQIKDIPEYKEHYSNYKITVMGRSITQVNPATSFISGLTEELLSKKEYNVTGTGYKEDPLELIIYTSVTESDPNIKEFSHNLETAIQNYLKSDNVSKLLDGKTYRIVIQSKEGTNIN
ncbi:DUF4030 domain-containing protein [Neobacillus sp.]|uniref:DUF4030 domain-containing protein n=1 Tax=Neobacillus sp. TaxID=2675273 RepID=UPI00289B28A8|nr:DUF4030 domain-containing protein [Neobacillus sp.]